MVTSPSAASARNASRTGMRDTPISSDSRPSTRRSPGVNSPLRMRSRNLSRMTANNCGCCSPIFSGAEDCVSTACGLTGEVVMASMYGLMDTVSIVLPGVAACRCEGAASGAPEGFDQHPHRAECAHRQQYAAHGMRRQQGAQPVGEDRKSVG
ncbi:hypothetical protein G6F23_014420 [Rhizopus arrhizus]|nr:hypothetical protein G6F23_014420 [Rhizopus arrhizus]